MELLIILLMVVVVVLIIGYPLVRQGQNGEPEVQSALPQNQSDLFGARESVFDALGDLQFEYATGKLSTEDYERFKARYEIQAADILHQIDTLKPKKERTAKAVCPRCNAAVGAQDKFCTRCGAKV